NDAGILLGEKTFGDFFVEEEGGDNGKQGHKQHNDLMTKDPFKTNFVTAQQPLESALSGTIKQSRFAVGSLGSQEPRAEHGSERERNNAGDEDGETKSDGKFVEQAANQTTHKEQGNEDGDQRGAHGNDGETNLFCAFE